MGNYIVTTNLDVVDATDGETSLREALVLANSNPDESTITFASGAGEAFETGSTIVLTGGQLELTSDISIDGDVDGDGTPDVTIDANSTGRVMFVNGSDADVDLNGLTLTGGNADTQSGGGIFVFNDATLDVTDSVISGNTAAYGGGISNGRGTVTISSSTIASNRAVHHGGGVNGSATIEDSAIIGNYATFKGSGIMAGPSLDISNTSVVGNRIGLYAYSGGAIYSRETMTASHLTMTGNSGLGYALKTLGNTTITNSIIAGNDLNNGRFFDASISENGTVTDSVIGGAPTQIFAAIDPDTGGGLIADNGGPLMTVALKDDPTNPALDIGSKPAGLETDAIGNPREADVPGVDNGGTVDAGAVELVVTTTQTVTLDEDGSRPWESITNTLDGEGTRIAQTIVYDDGRIADSTFSDGIRASMTVTDPNDARSWASLTDTFDENGDRTERSMIYDDGRIVDTTYSNGIRAMVSVSDEQDNRAWTSFVDTFDATGTRDSRTMIYDDGRVVDTTYEDGVRIQIAADDAENARNWSSFEDTYIDGERTARTMIYDDGREAKITYIDGAQNSLEMLDLNDQFSWARYVDTFDTFGDRQERTITFDDGSEVTRFYGDDLD